MRRFPGLTFWQGMWAVLYESTQGGPRRDSVTYRLSQSHLNSPWPSQVVRSPLTTPQNSQYKDPKGDIGESETNSVRSGRSSTRSSKSPYTFLQNFQEQEPKEQGNGTSGIEIIEKDCIERDDANSDDVENRAEKVIVEQHMPQTTTGEAKEEIK
eukprot:CAMPEP_0116833200 /NCGR_PEP_ID=MMETSP0418-20121206/6308_1 /TAXON_ID=1158023 /ORGANISM="Astrosyne radiata, Strain 13vi08-1A" /LENGTH=154 /DNA_ID=CAMNT_0004462631 /DNA_START=1 /DNA_END=465 /DNA_ORIENTATION=-